MKIRIIEIFGNSVTDNALRKYIGSVYDVWKVYENSIYKYAVIIKEISYQPIVLNDKEVEIIKRKKIWENL